MSNFAEILQQGTSHAWLYFPSAILLGALHGLEPGHSKTMMAALLLSEDRLNKPFCWALQPHCHTQR
jgi:ABC-type nickel/cobalt efflux system permease component RcnA